MWVEDRESVLYWISDLTEEEKQLLKIDAYSNSDILNIIVCILNAVELLRNGEYKMKVHYR